MMDEWLKTPADGNPSQHQEIAKSFIADIAYTLEVYEKSKGYTIDFQYYKDMAWSGLEGTSLFKQLSIADQNRIKNMGLCFKMYDGKKASFLFSSLFPVFPEGSSPKDSGRDICAKIPPGRQNNNLL